MIRVRIICVVAEDEVRCVLADKARELLTQGKGRAHAAVTSVEVVANAEP